MKRPREFYESVATLTGGIIGAGILGIPFVATRAGFWTTMLMLVVVGCAMLLIHLMLGEVALRSDECHQLVGYADKYLGAKGRWGMTVSMVIGCYGAMIAYTLGVSKSLSAIFGGDLVFWTVAFYSAMCFIIFGNIKALGGSELFIECFKFGIFGLILVALFSSQSFNASKLIGFSFDRILLPFGVIMFAVFGTAAIPEVRAETKRCSRFTKSAIILGSLIPIVIYAVFTAAVVGVSGGFTTEVATIGLSEFTGPVGAALMHGFAILAMVSSFIVMGFALKNTFWRDFGLKYSESWALTMVVPILAVLLGVTSFVRILDLAGAFAGGIAGILIVAMHSKARSLRSQRKPEYRIVSPKVAYLALAAFFSVGMLYQLVVLL